jgi:folate-binding protein YgfZ
MSSPSDSSRAFLTISGDDRVHFLQGILTQDVTKLAGDKIQFAALLSAQGKILHDMFLIDQGDTILLDTAAMYKDLLLKRLAMYKLRAKVAIADASPQWQVGYSTTDGLPDPRHPGLPKRLYGSSAQNLPATFTPEAYHAIRLQLGIPDSTIDFSPDTIVPMDAGYDLLHGISFTKGCYVGQEITARMHYKNIARRGFYLLNDASGATRLSLLKFEDMEKSDGLVTVDNQTFTTTLPAWMEPKHNQFIANRNNQ